MPAIPDIGAVLAAALPLLTVALTVGVLVYLTLGQQPRRRA
jgi:hypothetical protein